MNLNVVPISAKAPEPDSSMDYALRYAALGWNVLPVWGKLDPSKAKEPIGNLVLQGFKHATTDKATIRRWYTQLPDAGVAITMGSNGLVGIDIDPRNGGLITMELLEAKYGSLVSDVLQFTQGGGEHRIFYFSGHESALPGSLGKGVDVKYNGYLVVEPTIGPKGSYAWEALSNPLEGAVPSPLPDWLRDMVRRETYYATHADSVAFAMRHATETQLEELREALACVPSDDRDMWVRFGLALKTLGQCGFDTWDEWSKKSVKYDPVDVIRVWRSANPTSVNIESIFHVASNDYGWRNPLAGASDPIPSKDPLKVKEATIDEPQSTLMDDHLLRPPGALGLFVDFYQQTAAIPQPEFAVQSALALGSVVCGRHYKTARKANFSNLWFMIVGKSGCGKEHPKTTISQVLRSAGKDKLLADGYTSRAGIFSKLDIAPAHISIIDEIGRHLEVSKHTSSHHLRDAVSALMESFNRSHGVMQPPQYSMRGATKEQKDLMSAAIFNPCITLLGMTTPNTLYSTVDLDAVQDGFLGRFILVETDIEGTEELTEDGAIEPPQALIDWVQAAMSYSDEGNMAEINPPGMEPTVHVVEIDDAAWEVFGDHKKYEFDLKKDLDEKGVSELANRSVQKTIRVALVLSVSVDPINPVITAPLAHWASDYVRVTEKRMIDSVTKHMVSGRLGKLIKQVADYILKGGPAGKTLREIKNAHFGGHGRDLDEVLKSLVDGGRVQYGEVTRTGKRGRKRVAYVHNRYLAEDSLGDE